jgi:hypothetical protein
LMASNMASTAQVHNTAIVMERWNVCIISHLQSYNNQLFYSTSLMLSTTQSNNMVRGLRWIDKWKQQTTINNQPLSGDQYWYDPIHQHPSSTVSIIINNNQYNIKQQQHTTMNKQQSTTEGNTNTLTCTLLHFIWEKWNLVVNKSMDNGYDKQSTSVTNWQMKITINHWVAIIMITYHQWCILANANATLAGQNVIWHNLCWFTYNNQPWAATNIITCVSYVSALWDMINENNKQQSTTEWSIA